MIVGTSTSCCSRTEVRAGSLSMRILGTSITCSGTRTSCGAKASTNSCSSISGTGTSSIGARMMFHGVPLNPLLRPDLHEAVRPGSPQRQAGHPRPSDSTGCLPPGEGDASESSPQSSTRNPPPRPWPSSVLVRNGATSRPGPLRRSSAHAATSLSASLSSTPRGLPARVHNHKDDTKKGRAWDRQPVVVVVLSRPSERECMSTTPENYLCTTGGPTPESELPASAPTPSPRTLTPVSARGLQKIDSRKKIRKMTC